MISLIVCGATHCLSHIIPLPTIAFYSLIHDDGSLSLSPSLPLPPSLPPSPSLSLPLSLFLPHTHTHMQASSLAFDYSGVYLAVGSDKISWVIIVQWGLYIIHSFSFLCIFLTILLFIPPPFSCCAYLSVCFRYAQHLPSKVMRAHQDPGGLWRRCHRPAFRKECTQHHCSQSWPQPSRLCVNVMLGVWFVWYVCVCVCVGGWV